MRALVHMVCLILQFHGGMLSLQGISKDECSRFAYAAHTQAVWAPDTEAMFEVVNRHCSAVQIIDLGMHNGVLVTETYYKCR